MLGAGGLGSVIGGYLAETGVDVTLIGRPAHIDAIRAQGLRIEGRRGSRLIRSNLDAVTHPDQARGHFDYLILAVKSKDTDQALEGARGLASRVDTVLSLQNNLVKEQELARWAGPEKVLGASVVEGGTIEAPGVARNHVTAITTFYCGELDGRISPRAERLAAILSAAGLPARATDRIQQVLWEKLCQICNASAWSVSALAGNRSLGFADGATIREGAEHYVTLAREILSVYTAMGYRPQNFFAPLSRLRELHEAPSFDAACESIMSLAREFKSRDRPVRTSMHEDVLNGRKSEADWIFRPVLEKGRELRLELPTLTACYRIIRVLDAHAR